MGHWSGRYGLLLDWYVLFSPASRQGCKSSNADVASVNASLHANESRDFTLPCSAAEHSKCHGEAQHNRRPIRIWRTAAPAAGCLTWVLTKSSLSFMETLPTATPMHSTFFSWNLTEDLISFTCRQVDVLEDQGQASCYCLSLQSVPG